MIYVFFECYVIFSEQSQYGVFSASVKRESLHLASPTNNTVIILFTPEYNLSTNEFLNLCIQTHTNTFNQ